LHTSGLLFALRRKSRFRPKIRLLPSQRRYGELFYNGLSGTQTAPVMTKKQPNANTPASFEAAMTELKQLVTRMEAGELPLDASVAAYQRGAELVNFCSAQLEDIEKQIKVLEGEILKPFAADGETE
jgi:exodeoxyribonuclease VII small subunit